MEKELNFFNFESDVLLRKWEFLGLLNGLSKRSSRIIARNFEYAANEVGFIIDNPLTKYEVAKKFPLPERFGNFVEILFPMIRRIMELILVDDDDVIFSKNHTKKGIPRALINLNEKHIIRARDIYYILIETIKNTPQDEVGLLGFDYEAKIIVKSYENYILKFGMNSYS